MLPPAPARFSTTTCWPSSSPSAGATMRAVVSVPPPGSNPTTVVIGFAGYWASAAALAVILAIEAFLYPRLARRGIVIGGGDLANDAFRCAQGERGVGGDHLAILARRLLQLGHRHDLVHQAHAQRLLGDRKS